MLTLTRTHRVRLVLLAALALFALTTVGSAGAAKPPRKPATDSSQKTAKPPATPTQKALAAAQAAYSRELKACAQLHSSRKKSACVREATAVYTKQVTKIKAQATKPTTSPTTPAPKPPTYPAVNKAGFLVGVNDDSLKWTINPSPIADDIASLGAGSVRITADWSPGQTDLNPVDQAAFDRLVPLAQARGFKLLFDPVTFAARTPNTPDLANQYCTFVKNVFQRYPSVRSVNLGNEVNKQQFWMPQFNADKTPAAPAAYVQLLATCYDMLHSAFADANVVTSLSPRGNDNADAVSNISISPINFIKQMGVAYRASGRTTPIYDTWGQNVYGLTSAEPVLKGHDPGTVGLGDYSELVAALDQAFQGTAQNVPGENGSQIWYLEEGFQTTVDGHPVYTGTETDSTALSEQDQASQITAAYKAAYCQPYVGGLFNFHLADESNLLGWQSGVEYADGTHKASYSAFQQIAAQVKAGTLSCG